MCGKIHQPRKRRLVWKYLDLLTCSFLGCAQVLTWSDQISNGSQSAVNWVRNSFRNWNNPVVKSKGQGTDGEQEEGPEEPVKNPGQSQTTVKGADQSQ